MKIRIAVVVDEDGNWQANGQCKLDIKHCFNAAQYVLHENPVASYIVEAELPDPPKPQIIQGKIVEKTVDKEQKND